jgi:uncharacterized membrane protein YoaK (UPF0700 family)
MQAGPGLKTGALSFIAGFVDTVGFIALFGLFTAHVTGNFVMLGAGIAGESAGALAKLLALPVFIVTVAAVTLVVRHGQDRGAVRGRAITAAQIIFLSVFMAAGGLLGPFTNPDSWTAIGVGMLGVIAMAIQNASSRLIDTGVPPTTIMTGNTTQAVIDAVDLLRKHDPNAPAVRRFSGLLIAVTTFAAGAVIGAVTYLVAGYWCLAIPIALTAGLLFTGNSAAPNTRPA